MRKLTTIDILFIAIIVFALILAFVVGCKDEAEATEPNFVIEVSSPANSEDISFIYYDHNGVSEEVILDFKDDMIVCSQPPKKAIEIIYKTLCKAYNIAPSIDFDLTVRFEEPNEPEPTVNWVEAVQRWPDAQGYIIDNFGRTTPISTFIEPEPNELNEPDYSIFHPTTDMVFDCDINDTTKAIEEYIPTWPDYIELEKDLYIIKPKPEDYFIYLEKGTKIYFKDN